ncbi:glycoside hydrolase [Dactylonectria estremocensis]|uniref:alpha-1,2-Mannosidase n=1 Tax=Dactylonectria estremocensis TaxID=1079267 RepID=A0A9P9DTJ9_9HYPO|nr:glycoside hydrolase [Dactylonectria estremocensis]
MFARNRTFIWAGGLMSLMLIYWWTGHRSTVVVLKHDNRPIPSSAWRKNGDDTYFWRTVGATYQPVAPIHTLPTGSPENFPKVQTTFGSEGYAARKTREQRRDAVKASFLRAWTSYKEHAWMSDELMPVSGGTRNHFGGWAATLVDSLDTLWIMGFEADFAQAVNAIESIDFTKTDMKEINVFETNIRYLGAFLAAFDLSGDTRLLRKAAEVGEMLYKAFDTPNRMPVTRWDLNAAAKGAKQTGSPGVLLAEIGSLSMEFTRLSQLTGNHKWFDAIQRITDTMAQQQNSTELPGLWPLVADASKKDFKSGSIFTLGAMADSTYEYLPKMAALLGGRLPVYQTMYETAMDVAMNRNLFRPMTPTNEDILISGQVKTTVKSGETTVSLESQGQHLVCFLGGVLALGGKLFARPGDVTVANKLTDGCVYTYKAFPHGIMPETFFMIPCESRDTCEWDENHWKQKVLERVQGEQGQVGQADAIIAEKHLPKGFTEVPDRRYILRPEAIESVFILYRVTGRTDLLESAWDMFQAIEESTKTELANTAVWDVTVEGERPRLVDSMESFWMGETLKYFYLIFSEPDLISLDEFVFNTEAHPLRRMI